MRPALCAAGLLLLTTPAAAQVRVAVATDKPEFVLGEPIVVVLEVQNEGTTPVGYPGDVSVSVPKASRRVEPNLFGCSGQGMGGGSASGRSSHEPMLKPGETQTFKFVVRGYDLAPGTYELQIVGTAGTGWSSSAAGTEPTAGAPARGGQDRFTRVHRVVVTNGDSARLQESMARYVTAAQAAGRDSALAKDAIIEAAPSFLEPVHGPLALARASNGDLITSQGDAVNPDPAHPSEIVEYTATGQFVAQMSVDPSAGAAFGLALESLPTGGFRFAAVDDATNVLDVWVVQ